MKPHKISHNPQGDLFKTELIRIIDMSHSLVRLGAKVDWDRFDEVFGEPQVECVSKGKAHKRYEFGCKVSVAATSKGGWFVGAKALHGNPYDGHTLSEALEQVERLVESPEHVFVDRGYRGHNYEEAARCMWTRFAEVVPPGASGNG